MAQLFSVNGWLTFFLTNAPPLLSDVNCVRWLLFAFDFDSGYEAAIFPDNLSYQDLLMFAVTLPCATIIILLRFSSGKGAVLTPCSCGFPGGIYNLFGFLYLHRFLVNHVLKYTVILQFIDKFSAFYQRM